MLDKLNGVDWAKLSEIESGAADIPILFKEITTVTDEDLLNWKLKALYDRVVHQGQIFPHSVYIIPTIIDILTYQTPLTAFLVSLLTHIAKSAYPQSEDPTYADLSRQARREIGKGVEVYLNLVTDANPFVRQRTLELIAELREYAAQIRTSLLAMLRSERDEQRAAEIKKVIGVIA